MPARITIATAEQWPLYQNRNGGTVALVPKGDGLVAVLGDALYPVKHVEGDEFRNGAGQPVRFRRSAQGTVDGLFEGKDFFPLISSQVPVTVAALVTPATEGMDYQSVIPQDLHDGLHVGSASEVGIDQKVLDLLTQSILDEHYPNVHSVLLWKDGKLFYERYFYGFDVNTAHPMRSATKSFDSALVGIAIDEKLIPGVDSPVVNLLPPANPPYTNFDSRKKMMTLGDLLSMRSGLACDDDDSSSPGKEERVYGQPEWVRFAMDLPMASQPGTVAHYCSAGPIVAGRIVEYASGESVLEFAQKNLFQPLGFSGYRWPYQTVSSNTDTYGELFLRPRDMLKLGVLFSNGGVWQGKQIISADWIKRSTEPVTQLRGKGYGYFWWHQSFSVGAAGRSHMIDTIMATGNGGQKIFIVPSYHFVAVFTGGNYNSDRDTPPNQIMPSVLLPQLLNPALR
jgi:CubicO group peptidase (beta-lactamase class C family)